MKVGLVLWRGEVPPVVSSLRQGSTVSNAEAWLFGCSERLTLGGGGGACLERTAIIATQRQTGGISVSGQLNLNL